MSRRVRFGASVVIALAWVGALYWFDFATANRAIQLSYQQWLIYFVSPGILLSYLVSPAGVHGNIDFVKLGFVLNVVFYSGATYGALSLIGRARKPKAPLTHT
jgi:hypothetical protein